MWRYVLLSMRQINMWLDLQKPTTYAHNGKESFSSSIDSSINKLITATPVPKVDWSTCEAFLRPVRCPQVFGCPLNATGQLAIVQAATLLEITTQLIHDVGYELSYLLWHFECNGTLFWAISPWKLLSFAVTTPLWLYPPPPTLHPYIIAHGVDKNLSKMAGSSASCTSWSG